MTSTLLTLIRRAAVIFAAATLLTACGGGSGSDSAVAYLRVVNATADVAAVDLTVDNDSIDEKLHATGVAADAASDSTNLAAATYILRLRRGGGTTAVATTSFTLDSGDYKTAIAYGREGALKLTTIEDDTDAPSSGYTRVRVFNSSADAGAVDIYLTDASTLLDEVTANIAAIGGGNFGTVTDVARGSYRLRVTGRDDRTDLRLDVANVVLGDKEVLNIVLQPSTGGVLVHALVLPQRGAPTAYKNGFARARLVAAASGNAAVSAQVGSTSINVNLRSPSVGGYTLVPAGAQSVLVTVNGSSTLGGSMSLTAGGDYSLLAHGTSTAPVFTLLTDDNRLPSTSGKARMRLVHAAAGVDGGLTLSKDFVAVANAVGYGSASTPLLVDSSTGARLEVTSPLSADPLYALSDVVVTSGGVYTMFVLGGAASPAGVLRRDR